jgi:hypothetical protein
MSEVRQIRLSLVFGLPLLLAACNGGKQANAPVQAGAQADSMAAMDMPPASGMKHGNHIPKYGGVVLMNGDLHFEVVLKPTAEYTIYFSDAARQELPASTVSNVTITVKRPRIEPEVVHLRIGDAGENWIGSGKPITSPATEVRVDYLFHGQDFWAEVPYNLPERTTGVGV